MEHFIEILLHAIEDTLPLLPWILVLYVVIQLVETKVDTRKINNLGTRLGPVVGAATGLIPQCGFSVMAAKFFERKYITVGTLLAIFVATSDEAFILMLGSGEGAVWVLPMLAVKVLVGIGVGYTADGIVKLLGKGQVRVEMPESFDKQPETVHDYFMQQYLEEKEVDTNCSCGRQHDGDSPWKNYLLYPILHALRVVAFIFLVNFVLTAIIHSVGEEKFAAFMYGNRFVQPFVACLIGLIPNCASSVVLTEAFLSGAITFGTCAAGLCANAGMGFVVLLRNTRKWKRNLLLIGVCYAVSVLVGLLLNVFPL
jgi:hypothetical protein